MRPALRATSRSARPAASSASGERLDPLGNRPSTDRAPTIVNDFSIICGAYPAPRCAVDLKPREHTPDAPRAPGALRSGSPAPASDRSAAQPCRIAHSRTLRCNPTTCHTQLPAGLEMPPSACIASWTGHLASSWRAFRGSVAKRCGPMVSRSDDTHAASRSRARRPPRSIDREFSCRTWNFGCIAPGYSFCTMSGGALGCRTVNMGGEEACDVHAD
jgi:hypothetical protein